MAFKLKSRPGGPDGLVPIKKFTTVGESVEGIYRGKRQGKPGYPPLLIIGDVAIPTKKQLEDYFQDMPIGALVRVTFKGKVDIKGGKTMNTFEVEVDEGGETTLDSLKETLRAKDYETLAAKLPPAVRKAIEDMFPDPATRLARVQAALAQK